MLLFIMKYVNNIPNIKLVTVSFVTVLIILGFSTSVLNNVDAPPFGRPYKPPSEIYRPPSEIYRPPSEIYTPPSEIYRPPSEIHNYRPYEPLRSSEILNEVKPITPETILKSTIAKENLIQHSDSREMRAEKINKILNQLDINTLSLDKSTKDGIWRDAYTFANTVIMPVVGNVVAKFLLELSYPIFI